MTTRRVFWLLLLLAIVGAYHYRRVGWDVISLGYQFGWLHLTKKPVAIITAEPDIINIYIESSLSTASFIKPDQMETVIREAYGQYRLFLEKYYPQIIGNLPDHWHRKKTEEIDFIFVSQTTFEILEKTTSPPRGIEPHTTNAHLGFFNTIYFKINSRVDPRQTPNLIAKELKPVIRHEIFHYLNNYFGLTKEFEESAAKKFGETNQF